MRARTFGRVLQMVAVMWSVNVAFVAFLCLVLDVGVRDSLAIAALGDAAFALGGAVMLVVIFGDP